MNNQSAVSSEHVGENWLPRGREDKRVAGGRCKGREGFHWFFKMGETEPTANADWKEPAEDVGDL